MKTATVFLWLLCFSAFAQLKPSQVITLHNSGTNSEFYQVIDSTATLAAKPYRVPVGKVLMVTDISAVMGGNAGYTGQYPIPFTLAIHSLTGTNRQNVIYANVGVNVAYGSHQVTPIAVSSKAYLIHDQEFDATAIIVTGYLTTDD